MLVTTLPEQALHLLQQPGEALATPTLQAEMLRVALACHARMLELGESDRHAAAAHALAGADLLEALAAQPGPQPEWLDVHLEQCCRYGGIWIHSLLNSGTPLPDGWPDRAAALLAALPRFHDQPLPWLAPMRADLLHHQPARSQGRPLTMVVVGNCQSYPLMLGLEPLLPEACIQFCTPVHLATSADVGRLQGWLADADLLICHRVQPGYRDGLGLDTPSLRRLLPASGRCLVLPNLHYEGCHPWIGYSHDPDGRLADLEAESPLGPYHDFLAMAAAEQDLSAEELLQAPCSPALAELLRHTHRHSLAELRQREQDCDLGLADWIEAEHQRLPLMHTINHPTQLALDQLLRRLVAQLDQALPPPAELFDTHEHLGELSLPIHPWVRQALGLGPWAEQWGQRRGRPLPVAEQLQESIAFYRRHPGLAAANTNHPKLKLAQRCLDLRHNPAPAAATPAEPPPLVDLLHLHGYQCAGTTLIDSLERACSGRVAYVETQRANERLAWEQLSMHLDQLPQQTRAITSHLITLPPQGKVARIKVAFLRHPIARIIAMHRLHGPQDCLEPDQSLATYAEGLSGTILANAQTRWLSPQDASTWGMHHGWGLDPEHINLLREDLFVGLVERYNESIVALEERLRKIGLVMNLAYINSFEAEASEYKKAQILEASSDDPWHSLCALDFSLYQRASDLLDDQLGQIPNLQARLEDLEHRCTLLKEHHPAGNLIKPTDQWLRL